MLVAGGYRNSTGSDSVELAFCRVIQRSLTPLNYEHLEPAAGRWRHPNEATSNQHEQPADTLLLAASSRRYLGMRSSGTRAPNGVERARTWKYPYAASA